MILDFPNIRVQHLCLILGRSDLILPWLHQGLPQANISRGSIPEQNICPGFIQICVILLWYDEISVIGWLHNIYGPMTEFVHDRQKEEDPRIWTKLVDIWNQVTSDVMYVRRA
jgi:hypothetical protein